MVWVGRGVGRRVCERGVGLGGGVWELEVRGGGGGGVAGGWRGGGGWRSALGL